MSTNINAPETSLSKLICAVTDVDQEAAGGLPSWLGSLQGQIWMAPDIDEAWAEVVRLMEEGPVFPTRSA